MKLTYAVLFLCIVLLGAGNAFAQEDQGDESGVLTSGTAPTQEVSAPAEEEAMKETANAEEKKGPVKANNKLCPVSGEEVGTMGEIAQREYNGKIYNFCCAMCLNDFDNDPEKYVAIVEEMKSKEESSGGGSDEEMREPVYD